jgi:hypothetical protein
MGLSHSPSPLKDLPSGMDKDSSEASFRPCADEFYSQSYADPSSTDPTSSGLLRLPASHPLSKRRLGPGAPPDYSDDLDENTDEDI